MLLHPLPPPPSLKKMLGPSFILLGLGLGSGELILWPYLTSNFGLGLAWAIVLGVTMQFFINMEVSRYALIFGESIFVGFARWLKFLPFWFIFSTILGFGWPGIGLSSSTLFSHVLPISPTLCAIVLFILIGLILSLGKYLYTTVERLVTLVILIGTPFILLLTFFLSQPQDWQSLYSGLVGIGPNYLFLPSNLPLAVFLGAIAFSGAGGNLNLAQSFYIRDKGYGMGAFSHKIGRLFANSQTHITLSGATFPLTKTNLSRFRKWWFLTNMEHFLVFFCLGVLTMLSLALLAYITSYGRISHPEGLAFILQEAQSISQTTQPFVGVSFMVIAGLMLAATQLTVLDSTSRIITENILLLRRKNISHVSLVYYLVLWSQISISISILLLGFTQPHQLVTLSAAINGFTMFIYIGLLLYHHHTKLPFILRPSLWRSLILLLSFLFFGLLCLFTLFPFL